MYGILINTEWQYLEVFNMDILIFFVVNYIMCVFLGRLAHRKRKRNHGGEKPSVGSSTKPPLSESNVASYEGLVIDL